MKKYYIDGIQVSQEEAEKQIEANKKALATNDLGAWKKCKFIIIAQ